MLYRGSCHCGKVTIEVEAQITGAVSCNCSVCSKRGSLLAFVQRDQMKVTGEADLATYTFNKHVIKHASAGIARPAFRRGRRPNGVATAAINIRCRDNFEFDKVPDAALTTARPPDNLDRTLLYMRRHCRFPGRSAWGIRGSRSCGKLSSDILAVLKPACWYQMYHAFALFAAAWGFARWHTRAFAAAGCCSSLVVIFSGSLYLLVSPNALARGDQAAGWPGGFWRLDLSGRRSISCRA